MKNKPSVTVDLTPAFLKTLKQLRKKYPHISTDIQPVIQQLENGETPGDQVQGVGRRVYKVRIRNTDAKKGKSGGYRVLYYLRTQDHILLFDIYAKGEQGNIQADEIRRMIDDIE